MAEHEHLSQLESMALKTMGDTWAETLCADRIVLKLERKGMIEIHEDRLRVRLTARGRAYTYVRGRRFADA